MDYALKYLPVLALLLLSGHIRKGDQIDLPLPHPEAWAETVAWVYTGKFEPSEGAKANIEHLGGRVEEYEAEEKEERAERTVVEDGDESDSELSEPPEDI